MRCFADNFIHTPFIAMPFYFAVKSLFLNGTFLDGLILYNKQKWDILFAAWKIWIPTIFIMMYFIPFEFKVLFVGMVSLFWLSILSFLSPMKKSDNINNSTKHIQNQTDIDQTLARVVDYQENRLKR